MGGADGSGLLSKG
jgi:hypothetical protein